MELIRATVLLFEILPFAWPEHRKFIVLLSFAMLVLPMKAQIFPLQTDTTRMILKTRQNNAFLVNGYAPRFTNDRAQAQYILARAGIQGINTLVAELPLRYGFDAKGKPQRKLRQEANFVKFLIREASLLNMAVMLQIVNKPVPADSSEMYLRYFIKKFGRAKNVLWLFNTDMLPADSILRQIPPRQLKAATAGNNSLPSAVYDLLVFNQPAEIENPAGKPALLQINTIVTSGPDAATCYRHMAYPAVLRGAAGTIVIPGKEENPAVFNPVTNSMRQLKTVFDSLHWNLFRHNPMLVERRGEAAIRPDTSAMIYYITSDAGFPVHLPAASADYALWWICASTGKLYRSKATVPPAEQIFLPPYQDGKNSDWLIFIRAVPK